MSPTPAIGIPDVDEERLKRLVRSLINIYSPSGKEEELLLFLDTLLGRYGMVPQRVDVEESRYNLLLAPEEPVDLMLLGHIDTVPAFDMGMQRCRIRKGTVHGLGAADMKGGCAAMVEAFLSYREFRGRAPRAALALVVGEEESGDGAEALVQTFRCPWAVVGEPTELQPCLGHFGYVEIELETSGSRAHASLSHREHNAVFRMLRVLLLLTGYLEEHHPEAAYNIRDLHSSEAGFAVPDRCRALVDLHLPPAVPVDRMCGDIQQLLSRKGSLSEKTRLSVEFPTSDAGYVLGRRGRIPQQLKRILEAEQNSWHPSHFRSHSDAAILKAAGMKPLIYGPGKLSKAHTAHESVPFAEIARSAATYLRLLLAQDDSGNR